MKPFCFWLFPPQKFIIIYTQNKYSFSPDITLLYICCCIVTHFSFKKNFSVARFWAFKKGYFSQIKRYNCTKFEDNNDTFITKNCKKYYSLFFHSLTLKFILFMSRFNNETFFLLSSCQFISIEFLKHISMKNSNSIIHC